MNRSFRWGILLLACLSVSTAKAGPASFFRRVFGNHEQKNTHPPKRRPVVGNVTPTPSPTAPPVNNDRPPIEPEVTSETSPTPTQMLARPASSVPPSAQNKRNDFPYGVPVTNKPGFVTSPYSPNGGYVDVRGFPSGTEVKDPYTGKIFITP